MNCTCTTCVNFIRKPSGHKDNASQNNYHHQEQESHTDKTSSMTSRFEVTTPVLGD